MRKTVYIDEYAQLVEQSKSTYTVTLQGSYEWHTFSQSWAYEIEKITPYIPIKKIYSSKKLHE